MKTSKKWLCGFVGFTLLAGSMNGQTLVGGPSVSQTYYDTFEISGNTWVQLRPGDSKTYELDGSYFVYKVHFQTEATTSDDATAEVWVNGDKKGEIFAPGRRDPHMFVTVERKTNKITVVGSSLPGQNGTIRIKKVWVEAKRDDEAVSSIKDRPDLRNPRYCTPRCDHLPFSTYHYRSTIAAIANHVIVLVDQLDGFTNHRDYVRYLDPIKKKAAYARAMAKTRGDASQTARPAYEDLIRTLDCAEGYLQDTFERDNAFELASELLDMREYLRNELD